jgi:hypothetical protein
MIQALFGQSVVINEYVDDEDEDEEYDTPYATAQRTYPPRIPAYQGVESDRPAYKAEPPRSTFRSAAEETRQMTTQPSSTSTAPFRGGLQEMQTIASRLPENGSEATKTLQLRPAQPDDPQALQNGKCPSCHADVTQAEVFCPRCGRVL